MTHLSYLITHERATGLVDCLYSPSPANWAASPRTSYLLVVALIDFDFSLFFSFILWELATVAVQLCGRLQKGSLRKPWFVAAKTLLEDYSNTDPFSK